MSKSVSKFALAAGLVLAMAFTFSCSGDDGGDSNTGTCGGKKYDITYYSCESGELVGSCRGKPYYPEFESCENGEIIDGAEISSSSSRNSSSSGDGSPSSSSAGGNGDGGSVAYEGQTYNTVKIGTQTWLAKNLNYAVEGSKCYGEGGRVYDYDEDDWIELSNAEVQANCAKYGRLYDWPTAMDLPPNCNENSCSSQIQSKHRGICPSGWHIPSYDEWNVLIEAVGGEYTAGTKLKATSDWNWNDDEDKSGNGTDDYGFSALPGGYSILDQFDLVGENGYWWSAREEHNEYGDHLAYRRRMDYDSEDARWIYNFKYFLLSVRCVKD